MGQGSADGLSSVFTLMFLNVNGLVPYKVDLLSGFLEQHGPSVLCIAEHFLRGEEICALRLDGYLLASHYCRLNFRRGGVAVFIRPDISYRVVPVHSFCVEKHAEFAAVYLDAMDLLLIVVYRSGAIRDTEVFMRQLELLLDNVSSDFHRIILAGDYNINILIDSDDRRDFLDLMASYNLHHVINDYTRIDCSSRSCIDNFLVTLDDASFAARIVPSGFSDHLALIMDIYQLSCSAEPVLTTRRIVRDTDLPGIIHQLESYSWDVFCSCTLSLDHLTESLINLVTYLINENSVAVRSVANGGLRNPVHWFSSRLRGMRSLLQAVETVFAVTQDQADFCMLRQLRAEYRRSIRHAKKDAYGTFISRSSNKIRSAWRIINYERCKAGTNNIPNNIAPQDFNSYFTSIASEIHSDLPNSVTDPVALVRHACSHNASFFFYHISESEVLEAILSLKNRTAPDCHGIPVKVVKAAAHCLVIPLTHIYNRCVSDGYFPRSLKISRVTPVYKKGDRSVLSNYRPISVASIFGKVFEIIIKNRLQSYFDKHSLLSSSQFGFRPGRNITQALTELVDFVTDGFDRRRCSSALLLDLHKAFDTVSHEVLICKLEHYGIRGLPLRLITSFLSDRRQFVAYGSSASSPLPSFYGVPQGSVLGPLLFIIFVNDFPLCVEPCHSILYADDTTLLISGSSALELDSNVTLVESLASEWFAANKLKLSANKTQKIVFSSTGDGDCYVGLLGVRIDQSLRWKPHIEALVSRLSSSLFVLRRLRTYLADRDLIAAYYGIIHSHLTYAVTIWGNSVHSNIVFRLQKRAVRIIARIGVRDSCREAFVHFRIMTLPSLFIFYSLINIHANSHNYLKHSEVHQYVTRHANDLVTLRSRIRLSSVNRPNINLYNILPVALKNTNNYAFRCKLKGFLQSHAFYSTSEFKDGLQNSWI